MANYFMSVTDRAAGDTISKDPDNVGTSTSASDKIELRMDQTCTQRQVLNAMELFERWIIQNGLDGLGANLPPLRG